MTKATTIMDIPHDGRKRTPGTWDTRAGSIVIICPECCTREIVKEPDSVEQGHLRATCDPVCGFDRVCKLGLPPERLKGGTE